MYDCISKKHFLVLRSAHVLSVIWSDSLSRRLL